jgi:hypothetical protein
MNSSLLSLDERAGKGHIYKDYRSLLQPDKAVFAGQVELTVRFLQGVGHGGCRRGRRGPQAVAVVFASLS